MSDQNIDPKIFRAYDIRGIYPDEINEQAAYKIGAALVKFLSSELSLRSDLRFVVGRDARISSPMIFKSLIRGITDQGADVTDIGLVSTDTLYFALNHLKFEGGVMISASHNPPEYGGVKMIAKGPKFVCGDWGIPQIKNLVLKQEFKKTSSLGKITKHDITPAYINHILSLIDITILKKMKVVVDAGNGMGSLIIKELAKKISIDLICLYCDLDGTFPNHPPDPLIIENTKDLQREVLRTHADFGLALDGDGDRTIFVDEKGSTLSGDMIVALFAKYFLSIKPGAAIVYNLTCSKSVPEIIKENGGKPIRSRTGHAFMKEASMKSKAIFAGEISGHLDYKSVYHAECGGLTLILMMKILCDSGKSLSDLIKTLERYYRIGEVNFKIEDRKKAIKKLAKIYTKGKQDWLDGLTVDFKNWWFNARPSNTEPLLRVVVEADNQKLAESKLEEIKKIIGVI